MLQSSFQDTGQLSQECAADFDFSRTECFVNERFLDNVLIAQEILHSMGNRREGKKLMVRKIDMEELMI